MRIRTALAVTAVTLLLSAHVRAQETVDKPGQEPKRIVAGLENKETLANQKQAIIEVRAMPSRVLRFQDSQLRIRTIITLADVLWGKGKDEPEARLLFLKADELIRSVRTKDNDSSLSQEKDRDVAAVSPSVLRSLKSLLVQKVSAFDAALGQRLSREYGLGDGSLADIAYQDSFAVSSMIKSGQIAAATKSLQNRINDNLSGLRPLLGFGNLLFELRAKDAPAADRVFIEAMVRMSGQPNVTADDVLIIGSYLFGSRGIGGANLADPRFFGTSPIQLGGVVVQSDVAQVRPGNSTAATHTYIGTATQILGRGSNDPEEMKRRAVGAYLLRPHAQALAPEFVPQLLSIERGPGLDFSPPSPTNRLPLKENGKVDLGGVLEAVDAIPTSKLRDEYILKTFRNLYSVGELDAASTVCEKMDDLTVRDQLVSLITFARAAKSLETSQIEPVQKGINRVKSSLQRFLLRLGLARLYLKQHDQPAAEALLYDAIKESRDDGDNLQQPYLVLSSVEMLASFNVRAAIDRLPDAIKAFNALGARRAQTGPTFRETVRLGGSSTAFDLRISGVNYGNFPAALKALSSDPSGVRAVLFELKDENILSAGMIAFAYAFL